MEQRTLQEGASSNDVITAKFHLVILSTCLIQRTENPAVEVVHCSTLKSLLEHCCVLVRIGRYLNPTLQSAQRCWSKDSCSMLVNFFANMLDSSILQFASLVLIAKSVIWSRISTSIGNADLGDMEQSREIFINE